MRTLAIGDIHGCYQSLKALEAAAKMTAGDRIVVLGDFVDRGPDTRSVLDWMMDRKGEGLIALRGNHELMMLAARRSDDRHQEWLSCGGDAVLDSYGVDHAEQIPERHWEFVASELVAYHIGKNHFFVHANAYPEMDLEEQPSYMLYWEREAERAPHRSGRVMVCGHTPQRNGIPLDMGHAVCIDTAACRGGWLTCLDVDAGYCWQANEQGDMRGFWLDQGPCASQRERA
ncbi:metallophosphoesterase family protein [Rhodopirellula sp. JC639]|uniref:metallophosphoesterase family protein n=1 Tax=Stieleria mannarensis TaxID=2755585 RepID=UPI0016034961|nr:metallophosphoesterase family protein [Rhodopirellula sp. JC639]